MRSSKLTKARPTAPGYLLASIIAGALLAGGLANLPAQTNQANAQTNIFNVGDAVRVTFAGTLVRMRPIRDVVRTNGTVTLCFDQEFNVAGKTPPEVEKEIRARYVPEYYADLKPRVRLLRADDFFYLNDKKSSCSLAGTLSEALGRHSGGFSSFSSFGSGITRVTLVHADGTSESLELKKIEGDPSLDPEILPGDKIYTFPQKNSSKGRSLF